jgi:exopolysaccharide biosynthesis polyprenyl glycosylphosphotransferase
MFKRFSTNFMVVLFLVDVAIAVTSLAIAMRLRLVLPIGQEILLIWIPKWVYVPTAPLYLMVGVIWGISFLLGSVYTPRKVIFWFEEFQRVFASHTVAALSLAGLLYLAKKELPRLTYLYLYIVALVLLLAYRVAIRAWYRLRRNARSEYTRVLIVGAGKVGRDVVAQMRKQHWSSMELVGFLDDDRDKIGMRILDLVVLGRVDEALTVIKRYQVDEVIIALPLHAHVRLANLVAELHQLPIRLHVVPDYFDLAFHGATIESVGGIPLIGLRDPAIDGFQRFVKRLTDIILSAFGILLLSPILLAVAAAIKLEDRGAIFYRAERVGENGRLFRMIKFRSMVVNADKMQELVNQADDQGHVVHKRAGDPRITRVGRVIRRMSIDELPQLLNVLKGDMSLVGPRPELPWLVEEYEPWQRKRFAVPQGITGWWQINGRSENLMHMHTEQDLYYIQHYSWWLDIQILWRTVSVVLRGKGAY